MALRKRAVSQAEGQVRLGGLRPKVAQETPSESVLSSVGPDVGLGLGKGSRFQGRPSLSCLHLGLSLGPSHSNKWGAEGQGIKLS